ncbi:MAG: globin domain-containing protein [Polyangiales bacterium]
MELGPAPSEIEAALARLRGLDQLVARLLATDPQRRPSSAAEVCDELALLEHRLAPDAGRGGSETLLGALCATPSESAWIALHGWLLGQPERHEALVGTATRMLDHWPPGLRRAPLASWESTRRGTEHPLWPLVRSLDLSARGLGDEEVARLAASPSLRSITHLDLSNNEIGNAGLAALADSPHLGALEHLDLSHNRFGSTGLEALVTRGAMRGLRALRAAHNGIGARGAEALANARLRLFELDLSGNELSGPGARALADAESLAGLRTLKLAQAKLGPDGVAALAVSPHLAHLQALDLALNGIGPSGAAALALTTNARGLRRLDLSRNGLGREGLQLLLASQHLDDLRELDLSSNALGATGAMLLASAPFVRRLERLMVSDDQLGDAGVAALLGSPHLGGLRALAIAQNEVTASGATLFASAPPQLESLDLSLNPLGDAGAEAAAEALRRLRIETLRVAGASLGANGVAALLRAGRLLSLDASQNAIGPDGALRLANAVGSLEQLALAGCNLGPRGARALLGAPGRLRDLDLASNALGDDGATALVAAAPNLARLERLNLADDGIGADGAEALAVSSLATHLRELSLADGSLGDAGAEALARGRAWHALRVLDLRGNGISLAGASTLAGSPSLAMLERLTLSSHVLTSDLDVHSLAPAKAERMEETFAEVASMGVDFAEQFYDELFARFPTVKPLFAKVTMARQHQHLLSALALVVDNLREPDRVEQALMELGARHWGYGTVPTHYQAVVGTLLDVLRDALGDRWDETAHEAWSDGLRAVANVMMRSGRPTPEGLATEPTRRGAVR